jgi:3',5'-cyclic AMP phosphodiesterase CpdA
LCALLAAIPGWSASDEPSLEFIQLTDTHLANLAGAEARVAFAREHFAPSTKSLAAFFAGPGLKYRPSFYLITGDLTDAFRYEGAGRDPVYGQVENFARAAVGSAAPVYLALGNHDIQHYAVNPATGNRRDYKGDMAKLAVEKRNIDWLSATDPMQIPLRGQKAWARMEEVYHNE